jgi:hypothetical protein
MTNLWVFGISRMREVVLKSHYSRRTPGAFFFFLLTAFLLTLCMSVRGYFGSSWPVGADLYDHKMIFRTIASASRTFTQAMTPTT